LLSLILSFVILLATAIWRLSAGGSWHANATLALAGFKVSCTYVANPFLP
jgi:hypothetical protein